ncbi:hypothetical protein [Caulobacter sp. CCH5-E12]|uniref:hypothetical protein n=1 Tax=Caulobacter sp. CCH5-E12 TaxID=1768770 RepID=UPI00078620CF|nr:hypothetical protein [Caulobacter sp. CCH5-E12]
MSLTEQEFRDLVGSPAFQRLWTISQDVRAGRADAETVKAWESLRESMLRFSKTAERATARYAPEDRERILRRWVEDWAKTYWPSALGH